MALLNAIDGTAPLITPNDLDARRNRGEELQIIDERSARDYAKSHVPGAVNIPLAELRARAGELHPNTPTVTYFNKGVSGNAGQNVLLRHGFTSVNTSARHATPAVCRPFTQARTFGHVACLASSAGRA